MTKIPSYYLGFQKNIPPSHPKGRPSSVFFRLGHHRGIILSVTVVAVAIGLYLKFKTTNSPRTSTSVPYLDQLIATPEEKIDIGIVALNLAKDFYPHINVESDSKKVDEFVAKIRTRTGGALDPGTRIRTINTVIYRQEGYDYDFEGVEKKSIDGAYFNRVLDTKRGNCLGLTVLYLAVVQRLGYPIYPVIMPTHPFLRYVGGDLTLYNIEASNGGGYSEDEFYVNFLKPNMKAVGKGVYLRTSSYREFIGWHVLTYVAIFKPSENGPYN